MVAASDAGEVGEASKATKLEELGSQRAESAGKVEAGALKQYDRLRARKGTNIVVGITHGACGGCHMKLPEAEVIVIKTGSKINYCPNCSRIVYYTRDMVMESD